MLKRGFTKAQINMIAAALSVALGDCMIPDDEVGNTRRLQTITMVATKLIQVFRRDNHYFDEHSFRAKVFHALGDSDK